MMRFTLRRSNPADGLKAAQSTLADIEANIVELGQMRARKLVESEGIDEIAALDLQIERQQKAAAIHRDREQALRRAVRRAEQQQIEREQAARVAATEQALAKRDALAVKLETAIGDLGVAYFDLVDQNLGISRQWGYSNNALRAGALGEADIARMVSHALFAAGRPRAGVCRLPAPGNIGLGIIGETGSGALAERIAAGIGRASRDDPRRASSTGRAGGRGMSDGTVQPLPGVSDLMPAELPPEAAGARLAELKSDPKFVERYLSGETNARAEFARLHSLASKGLANPDGIHRGMQIDALKKHADLPPEAWAQVASNGPVFAHERAEALRMKDRVMRDKAWVSRYLDGGREETTLMTRISLIISSPVKEGT